MTKETKQQVFEDMALRYTMYLENIIYENGNRHSSDKEAQHDADKFRARYDAASDGDTDCPYCHEPHRVIPTDDEFDWGGESDNFLRIGMTGGDSWNGIPPKLTPGGAIHTVMAVGYENAEVDETISINYCPMCGRRLGGTK